MEFQNYGMYAGTNYGGMHTHHETLLLSRLITAQRLDRERIGEVMRRFAPRVYRRFGGAALDRARTAALLAESPYLVLLGAPGSGLGTAAEALLKEFSDQGRRLERIRIDKDQAEQFTGEDLPAREGAVYLLRLPNQTKQVGPHFAEALQSHAIRLKSINAHMLVTSTPDVWEAAGGHRGPLVFDVDPPLGADVLERHPFATQLDVRAVGADQRVKELLERGSAEDAARFARIIDATAKDRPDLVPGDLVTQALGAYHGWEDVLKDWFEDNSVTLRARLFLTAAAMLEGQPAHRILDLIQSLNAKLGLPGRQEGLEAPGLRALTRTVDAEIRLERLWFRKAGYAEAALAFLHSDRETKFRRALWDWAVGLAVGISRDDARNIANQVTEMMVKTVLRYQDPLPLYELKRWADETHLHDVVVKALTATAISEEVGQLVRAQLYEWASNETTDPKFQQVIARVCAGEMADFYPRMALTRLGHLAARRTPAVREEVVAAVLRLWERPELRALITRALTSWTSDLARRVTAWQILCRLAAKDVHPLALAGEQDDIYRDLLGSFSRLLSDETMAATVETFEATTLTAALRSEADRKQAVRFFTDVVQRSSGGTKWTVRLQRLAFAWQPVAQDREFPDRRELRDQVCEALIAADPLTRG